MNITRPGMRRSRKNSKLIIYVLLSVGGISMLVPFYWMLAVSLMTQPQAYTFPPEWIPRPLVIANYLELFEVYPWGRFFTNTMFIVVSRIIGVLLSSSMVAYGFSFFRFRGRNILFFVLLSTMMLPGVVRLVPLFVTFSKLKWVNTYLPLIVPAYFGGAFNVFLLRQFFQTLPPDLFDAAKIDGASELSILFRVILPLSKPVMAVLAIFTFRGAWEEFFGPLIYLQSFEKYTLALGLFSLRGTDTSGLFVMHNMAGAALMVVPVLVLFAFFQRYFIQGVTLTGIKG